MLLEDKSVFKPFNYPVIERIFKIQQSTHWLGDNIPMQLDVQDWNTKLTDEEKHIVGNLLKSFTQVEVIVGDYWRDLSYVFKHPEISMMCTTFSYFETIHQLAYDRLNASLDLTDYKGFLQEERVSNRLNGIVNQNCLRMNLDRNNPDKQHLLDIAVSIASFSAFVEGCAIFSSFMILFNFSRSKILSATKEIVEYSIRDEEIHSIGGIALFRELCSEYPYIKHRAEDKIKEAARLVYQLESNNLDFIFENTNAVRGLTKEEVLNYIANRLNLKLVELGYSSIFEIDSVKLKNVDWFDIIVKGNSHGDFFAKKITDYTNQEDVDPDSLW